MAAAKDMQSSPLVRQLASSDRRIRERALSSLRTYLERKDAFTDLELRKLWKGLFYCLWMADKPRNQQVLARDLAELVQVVSAINFLGFVRAFWSTIAAEWSNIDRLRMDKFLYLIRCYVNAGFVRLQRKNWKEEDLLAQYLEVLKEVPLNGRDAKIPNGLRYHVIDVYVDELDKTDIDSNAPLNDLLAPLRDMKRISLTKTVREKTTEAIEDKRLKDWPARGDTKAHEEAEANEDQEQQRDEAQDLDTKGHENVEVNEYQDLNGSQANDEDDFSDFGD